MTTNDCRHCGHAMDPHVLEMYADQNQKPLYAAWSGAQNRAASA